MTAMEVPDLSKTIESLEQQRDAIDRAVCALREVQVQGRSQSLKSIAVFHQRADHEDNLFVNRTYVFITFNAFLAVAVGLTSAQPATVRFTFIFMALLVDLAWCLWAPRSRTFIRDLRDAGGDREDEKRWHETIGGPETKGRLPGPLVLMSVYMPVVVLLGWAAILVATFMSPTSEKSYLPPPPMEHHQQPTPKQPVNK